MRVSHETIYIALFIQSRGLSRKNYKNTCGRVDPSAVVSITP